MPKLIVNAFLTLDGVMQAPGGPDEDRESGFQHGGWQFPYTDDLTGKLIIDGLADAGGFLLGRKTYEIFAGYWPKITDPNNPIAAALNSRPKYVASRTLERITWNNSRLMQGDLVAEVRKLREQPGTGVHTWGSTDLLQTLLKHDLVDELRTLVYPLLLGTGKRLFGDGTRPTALDLVESVTTGKGGVYLRYLRAGKPTYGKMG
ncbi:MAG TPA: dihydrofolate reductase family protein [Polyangia bacterium]|jgi:dihydrofolate reductase|nr:dihydrofolate reductase family protein [Polyangia bacterium]